MGKVHGGKFYYLCGLCGLNRFDTEEEKLNHRKFCKCHTATQTLPPAPPGQSPTTKTGHKGTDSNGDQANEAGDQI